MYKYSPIFVYKKHEYILFLGVIQSLICMENFSLHDTLSVIVKDNLEVLVKSGHADVLAT